MQLQARMRIRKCIRLHAKRGNSREEEAAAARPLFGSNVHSQTRIQPNIQIHTFGDKIKPITFSNLFQQLNEEIYLEIVNKIKLTKILLVF